MTGPDDALVERVRDRLAVDGGVVEPHKVAEAIRSEGRLLTDAGVLDMVDALRRESVGAGPLEALLRQPEVTDVLVNGPSEIYVDDGDGLRRVSSEFPDDAAVRRLAQRLAASAGRRLDDAAPFVDVRLPDGTRFHAVLAPIASPGTCLSLRVPARHSLSLDELVERGLTDRSGAALLADMVASRLAFVVVGGTGSGKTTLLSTLLGLVGPDERIVIVEDSAELRPRHPHVVTLEARPPNVEGRGAVALRDLVRQALRMRPDRLVVGEVRGAEVVDLLAALNTGHRGGCGTLHANGIDDVPARLEALGIAAGLSREAVHAQAVAGLEAVIRLERGAHGLRQLGEIGVFAGGGPLTVRSAVSFSDGRRAKPGPGAERLGRLLERSAR